MLSLIMPFLIFCIFVQMKIKKLNHRDVNFTSFHRECPFYIAAQTRMQRIDT